MDNLLTQNFIASPIPQGFTWTLTTRLGHMLRLAEQQFGERDKSYTVLGIEFGEEGPFIWYPGNCKNIAIQLSLEAMESDQCALYELAHECIHLLSPTGGAQANVLEEGLAVYFSWHYVNSVLGIDYKTKTKNENYRKAGLLVEKLLNTNPYFFLHARQIQNCIAKFDPNIFNQVHHELSNTEINFLLEKFNLFSLN